MDIVQNLKDAGFEADEILDICRLHDAGNLKDAVRTLRRRRCDLMEELHESQNRVDCLDYLVYQLEKELRENAILN